jgi:DNA-binding NtrC family response regulator
MQTARLVEPATVASLPSARIVVTRGPDRGRALSIFREESVVGSSAAADLRLTDATVSRNHFSLRLAGGDGILLTDLDSTNGTLIGGRRVRSIFVAPGDSIDAGASRLRLEATGPIALPLSAHAGFGRMLGASEPMRRLFATLQDLARESVNVLIVGETGSGKDAAAEALHEAGARAHKPFVVVDCGALPDGLVESELFGHARGAFTGAGEARHGALAGVAGGTLFFDEVGELPRALQPKLLGAIERRSFRPLGGEPQRLDARIVAATNRDLRLDVNRGLFREDLYYRISTVTVRVPPLRERPDDIPILATHFWRQLTNDPAGRPPDELLRMFRMHRWPGNVRELRNRVERAVVLSRAEEITGVPAPAPDSYRAAREQAIDAFERAFLVRLVERANNNVSQAARLAQMDRVYLTKLLQKHRLK